jgi:hypothetical protein
MAQKKENRGGARPGAGRPRKEKTVSEKVKANFIKAAGELKKEYGESIEKAILRLAFKDGIQDTAKIAILKAYSEALIAKESNKNVRIDESKRCGPIILPKKMMEMLEYLSPEEKEKIFPGGKVFLPEKKPDPAKLVPMAGRKSDN